MTNFTKEDKYMPRCIECSYSNVFLFNSVEDVGIDGWSGVVKRTTYQLYLWNLGSMSHQLKLWFKVNH